jgi:hypothetical protein
VRISYANMHTASQFQDRFSRVIKPGSPWLAANPRIHIWEEWSGIWDDAGAPQSLHEDNIRYLQGRQVNEGKVCGQWRLYGVLQLCVMLRGSR